MISVLFLATLVLTVGGQSLQKKDWSPYFQHTGGLSGYLGADFKSNKWNLGGALHGDLKKPGIFDGGRIHGGYQFNNGVKVNGFLQGYKGSGLGAGLGVTIPLGKRKGKGKRSVSCVLACYKECKQDTDCLEQCVLTYC